MSLEDNTIEGVMVTELRQIYDERGAILHMMRTDDPEFAGFGECYFSEIKPGAVKAWKRHRRQTQNLAVPEGKILLVIYDDREDSSTRHHLNQFELARPDAYFRIKIPPGLWYGFACLGSSPALIVNCPDVPHDPEEGETRPLGESTIPFDWNQ